MKNLSILVAGLVLAVPLSSFAEPAVNPDGLPVAVKVAHQDLDLTTPKGARLMIRRMEQAVADVCGAGSFSAREQKQAVRGACRQDSMNRALASLGAPLVNAMYYGQPAAVASN